MILTGALAAAMLQGPEVLAVRCEATPEGAVLKVLASAALDRVTTERSGGEIVVAMPAHVSEQGVPLPPPVRPVLSLTFVASSPELRLRVGVEAGTVLEVVTRGSLVTLEFQSPEQSGDREAPAVESLYPLLFPEAAAGEAPPGAAAGGEPERAAGEPAAWSVGPLSFEPSLIVRYIDGEATYLESPQPLRVRYFEMHPRIAVLVNPDVSPFGGRPSFAYEVRFRTGADGIPVLSRPSHFVSATFELPVGPYLLTSVGDQYIRGSLETQALDPGGEYFFNIGSFSRNELSGGLRTETPGPLDLAFAGALARETVAPGTGYFSNERRTVQAALRYDLGPTRTAFLGYALEDVPPPESRPLAEMRAHDVSVGIEGELTPLLQGRISFGRRWQRNPRAPAGGDRFQGSTWSSSLRRDLASGAMIVLGVSRSAHLSAFENNAFYVANNVGVNVTVPLRMGVELIGGASLHRNSYRLDALGLREPRKDRLWSLSAGLGRTLSSWSWLRADYAWSHRRSNVPGLSTRTQSFVVQLGLSAPRR